MPGQELCGCLTLSKGCLVLPKETETWKESPILRIGTSVIQKKVKQIFGKLGLGLENVRIVPGWFEVTLTTVPMQTIAVLHIDADWYDSVKTVLEVLYDKVVPGGFIILDDYGYWKGCTQAWHDFLSEHEIENVSIRRNGRAGAFLQKPTPPMNLPIR